MTDLIYNRTCCIYHFHYLYLYPKFLFTEIESQYSIDLLTFDSSFCNKIMVHLTSFKKYHTMNQINETQRGLFIQDFTGTWTVDRCPDQHGQVPDTLVAPAIACLIVYCIWTPHPTPGQGPMFLWHFLHD